MTDTALCYLTATELALKIRSGEISAVETMEAHLAQIEKVNPQVNAIVTLLPELALEQARKADEKLARRKARTAAWTAGSAQGSGTD